MLCFACKADAVKGQMTNYPLLTENTCCLLALKLYPFVWYSQLISIQKKQHNLTLSKFTDICLVCTDTHTDTHTT